MGDFGVFPAPWEGWFFELATLASAGRKFSKSVVWKKFFEKFLEKLLSFPEYILGMLGPRSRSEIACIQKKVPKTTKSL